MSDTLTIAPAEELAARNQTHLPNDASARRCRVDHSVPPLAQGILSERIPVLRFSGNRPGADKS